MGGIFRSFPRTQADLLQDLGLAFLRKNKNVRSPAVLTTSDTVFSQYGPPPQPMIDVKYQTARGQFAMNDNNFVSPLCVIDF